MFQSTKAFNAHINEALDRAALWIFLSTICLTVAGIVLCFVGA